tara:strand:+ start:243 stop:503 length:261 start_codon:yes stop_codon:yes gene_type:complete
MSYFVYMLLSVNKKSFISYVGYSTDPKKRLKDHNNGKGAKFTKGRKWKIIFKKKLSTKSKALKFEYSLKKNIKLRKSIKFKYINEH